MQIQSIGGYKSLMLRESHEERAALSLLRGANFTHCLRLNGMPVSIDVIGSKGETITIRGSDIYNKTAWDKFVAAKAQNVDLCRLTDTIAPLAKQYKTWLMTEYTSRYRSIALESDLIWLEQVACLVVARRIMETKYETTIKTGQACFADDWAFVEMSTLLALNEAAKEFAMAIHHNYEGYKKHEDDPEKIHLLEEKALELIEAVYTKHYNCIQNRPMVLRDPLPPLPAGTPTPLAMLNEGGKASA